MTRRAKKEKDAVEPGQVIVVPDPQGRVRIPGGGFQAETGETVPGAPVIPEGQDPREVLIADVPEGGRRGEVVSPEKPRRHPQVGDVSVVATERDAVVEAGKVQVGEVVRLIDAVGTRDAVITRISNEVLGANDVGSTDLSWCVDVRVAGELTDRQNVPPEGKDQPSGQFWRRK